MASDNSSNSTADRGITGDIAAFGQAAAGGVASSAEGLWTFVKDGVEGDYLLATDPNARAAAWDLATNAASKVSDYASATLDDPTKPITDVSNAALSAYSSFDQARLDAAAKGQSSEFWGNITGKVTFGAGVAAVTGGLGGVAEGAAAEGAEGLAAGLADTALTDTAVADTAIADTAAGAIEDPAAGALADSPVSEVADCPLKTLAETAAPTVLTNEEATALLVNSGMSAERAADYVASFTGPITTRTVEAGETFLRYTDTAESSGSFLTKQAFDNSQEAVDALYLKPYGNNATLVQTVIATSRTTVLEGGVANGAADAVQTVLTDRGAFQFGTGVKY